MKFREIFVYRMFDFAFPSDAGKSVLSVIHYAINDGVRIRSLRSGPLIVGQQAYDNVIKLTMLIEETHANRIISEFEEACKPFEIPDEEYLGWGD